MVFSQSKTDLTGKTLLFLTKAGGVPFGNYFTEIQRSLWKPGCSSTERFSLYIRADVLENTSLTERPMRAAPRSPVVA